MGSINSPELDLSTIITGGEQVSRNKVILGDVEEILELGDLKKQKSLYLLLGENVFIFISERED
jgi:hypothetical protein